MAEEIKAGSIDTAATHRYLGACPGRVTADQAARQGSCAAGVKEAAARRGRIPRQRAVLYHYMAGAISRADSGCVWRCRRPLPCRPLAASNPAVEFRTAPRL